MRQFPPFGKRFFRRARKLIGSCHFEYSWRIVTVLASLQKGHTLSKLEDATDERRSRQAISNFLTLAEWNAPELLQQTALDQLQRLGFRSGDTVYLLLDDTQKRKRGKLMAADVIADLELPQGARPIVLFDSYYLCHQVAQACEQRGWKYVGVAKKNRNFFPDGRPRDRRKLGT
jgi:hypothetical protein